VAWTFCSVSSATICVVTLSRPLTCSGGSGGDPTLTAITTSAPQRSRTSRTGRLSTRPPSTSLRPRYSSGASRPGTDMLARIASVRLPSRSTTRSPLPMSVAMIDTGSGRSSIRRSPRSAPTSWLKNSLIFWPETTPGGAKSPPSLTPTSLPGRKRCARRLARKFRSL